jgi:hypothetical protein
MPDEHPARPQEKPMRITVNQPDDDVDKVDQPLYEGPADQAHQKLAPGLYDTDIPNRLLLVRRSESWLAEPVPVATAWEMHDDPEMNR